ncbi:MAG: hypothetical protein ACC608_02515 [Anaerofustis sp.]
MTFRLHIIAPSGAFFIGFITLQGDGDGGRIETEEANLKTNQEVFDNSQQSENFGEQMLRNVLRCVE